ncbi:MAG TPA: hydroxyacylglutathione hydrolase [Gammaproteobacteria bacterium]|nr:hydroxyacylglutathione hydrolase [Gammaproteobacteria bacterium]
MQLYAQFSDNYIWLIRSEEYSSRVIVVDPGEAEPVVDKLNRLSLIPVAIFITHGCHDHIDGISDLLALYDIPVYGSTIEHIPGLSHPVIEGDVINISGVERPFKVLDTPGHTAGHITYYGDGEVFCGDTLFGAGCGRIFNSTPEQLYSSLQKIATLPDSTLIYCSHEYTLKNLNFAAKIEPYNAAIQSRLKSAYKVQIEGKPTVPSTLLLEKATNPFLRCHTPEVVAAAEAFAGKRLSTDKEVFVVLRFWKDTQ